MSGNEITKDLTPNEIDDLVKKAENGVVRHVDFKELEDLISLELDSYVSGRNQSELFAECADIDFMNFDPVNSPLAFCMVLEKLGSQGISIVANLDTREWQHHGMGQISVDLKGLSYKKAVLTVALAATSQ